MLLHSLRYIHTYLCVCVCVYVLCTCVGVGVWAWVLYMCECVCICVCKCIVYMCGCVGVGTVCVSVCAYVCGVHMLYSSLRTVSHSTPAHRTRSLRLSPLQWAHLGFSPPSSLTPTKRLLTEFSKVRAASHGAVSD